MKLDPNEPRAIDLLSDEQLVVYLEKYHEVEGDPIVKHACGWYKAVIDG